jgi:hypothetical protein
VGSDLVEAVADLIGVGYDHAALTGTDDLIETETEGSSGTERPDWRPIHRRTQRVTGVFQQDGICLVGHVL